MIQKYTFCDGSTLEFDDSKSVKELIEYAFDTFGYYEPMGMDIVTLFQAHHPNTTTGWFTTDTTLRCADEIQNRDWLCFAYHLPNVFYFAEGGWGHHMRELGNRPLISNEIHLEIRFEDFSNAIVINGNYTFMDIVRALKQSEYICVNCNAVRVIPVGVGQSYSIPFSDPIMHMCLTEFVKNVELYHNKHLTLAKREFIYHTIFELR